MATPRAASTDELLSSPDPLNASRDESYLPSSRRVTRSQSQVSHRYMSLGASNSPRKQTIALDIGSAKTPQRLFVTLETENDDQARIARTLFPSSTPARRARKPAATTKTVPLRDEDAPGAITPKRRGRGKRTSTPMKQTPGRSKKAKITETDDSDSDATTRPTSKSTASRKKTADTPQKRAATPKKAAVSPKKTSQRRVIKLMDLNEDDMSDTTVFSEQSNISTRKTRKRKAQNVPEEDDTSSKQSTKRTTGKARRMALIPEEIERIAEPILESVEKDHDEQSIAEELITEEPIEEPTEAPVVEEPIVEEPIAAEPIAEELMAEEPIAEVSLVDTNTVDTKDTNTMPPNEAEQPFTQEASTKETSEESWIAERRSSTPMDEGEWPVQGEVEQQEELESKPEVEEPIQLDGDDVSVVDQKPLQDEVSMVQEETMIQEELETEETTQAKPQAENEGHDDQPQENENAPEPDMWLAMSDAPVDEHSDFSDDMAPDAGPDDHSDINEDAPVDANPHDFSDSDAGNGGRPALDDTVAQGEDFSMIFAASIPSLRGSLGVRPSEVMDFGEETSFIINQTLESFRQSRAGETTTVRDEGSPDLSYDRSRTVQEQGSTHDDDEQDEDGNDDDLADELNEISQPEDRGDVDEDENLPVLPPGNLQANAASPAKSVAHSEWSEVPEEVLAAAVPPKYQYLNDERSPVKRHQPAVRISSPEMSALYEDPFLDIAEKEPVSEAPGSLARKIASSARKSQSRGAASSSAGQTPQFLARQSLARQILSSAQKSQEDVSSPVRSVAYEDEFSEIPGDVSVALTPAQGQSGNASNKSTTKRPQSQGRISSAVRSSARSLRPQLVDPSPARSAAYEDDFSEVPDAVLAAFTPAKYQYLYANKSSERRQSDVTASAAKSTSHRNSLVAGTDAEPTGSTSGRFGGRPALSPNKRHASPSRTRSSPRRKSVPLSRKLFDSKVQARRMDVDDAVSSIPIDLPAKSTPDEGTDHDESMAYNDSWSEIPEAILEAATPAWYLAQRQAEARSNDALDQEEEAQEHDGHEDVTMADDGAQEDEVQDDDAQEEDVLEHDAGEDDAQEHGAQDAIDTEDQGTQKEVVASSPRSRAASVASTQGRLPTPELTSSPIDSTNASHHEVNEGVVGAEAATLPKLSSVAAENSSQPKLDVLVTEPDVQQKSTPIAPEVSSQRPSHDANMLAPRSASTDLGHRPSLSPIVRAGLALQSVTSEASSPISRQNSLGSPFRPATHVTPAQPGGRSSERPATQRAVQVAPTLDPTETPVQRSTTSAVESVSQSGGQFTGARKGWFPPLSNIIQAGAKFFSPTAVTTQRVNAGLDTPAAKASAQGSGQPLNKSHDSFVSDQEQGHVASSGDSDSLRVAPPHEEESSWMVDEQSPAAAPREETVFQHQATSPSLSGVFGSIAGFTARASSVAERIQDEPEEAAPEDEEDIWEIEAQRDTPQRARQQPFGKRPSVRGTGSLRQQPFGTSPRRRHHPYAKNRSAIPSPWTKSGKENEPLGGAQAGVTPAKEQDTNAPQSGQKSGQSSRFKMSSFFSSPALLPGMENAQAALERKRQSLAAEEEAANRPAESPIHVLQTSNTMFPTVPFKSANPFANAKAPAPSSLRKSVLAPSTPDRSRAQSPGKSGQQSRGVSKLSFAPIQPAQSATPVRMHLSHADIERWQEDSALDESSSSPDYRLRFLRTLPAKNASPSKSAIRSPLKARTPGRVVEWDSGVESPMTQAQKRYERELEQAAVDEFARRQWEAQQSATRKTTANQPVNDADVSSEDVDQEDASDENADEDQTHVELVDDGYEDVEMDDVSDEETEEEVSSSPPAVQQASAHSETVIPQQGHQIELELQLQRERMEQHAQDRQEALQRQKEELEVAHQQKLEEEQRAIEQKKIERELYRKQAIAEWDQPLSRTVWGDTHYRYMHRLIKMRRKGAFKDYVFPEDFERRTGWLIGQTVFSHDETQQTLVLNAWHLNVIDVYMNEVKGVWDELELAIRLFSIVVMERLREEWHLPLDEIRKAMVAQRAALAAQAEAGEEDSEY